MSDDPDEPTLSIVSSRTDAEIAADECLYEINRATRRLAGNMIRVIRGAGRPYDLFEQFAGLYQLMRDAPEGVTVGHVTDQMQEALESGLARDEDHEDYRFYVHEMERGVLRMVAARLLQTPLQVTIGKRDFSDALQGVLRIQENRREERWAEEAALRHLSRAARTKKAKAIVAGRAAPKVSKPKKKPVPFTDRYPAPAPEVAPAEERPLSTAEFMKRRKQELGSD